MKQLRKLFRLPAKDIFLLTEAIFFLYLAKMMLLVFPINICLKTIQSKKSKGFADKKTLKRIKAAIRRANKLAFWKNVCLVQSFTGSWMLHRRGIKSTLLIGVKHDSHRKLIAHAWLKVDGFEIVPRGGDYLPLSEY